MHWASKHCGSVEIYSTSSEPSGNVLKLFAVLHYSELGFLPPGAGQRLKEESTLYKLRERMLWSCL